MKKLLLLFCVVCFTHYIQAQTPDFSIAGFASLEGEGQFYHKGGTTGGAGGEVVTPTTFEELKKYVENESTPYIIQITKEFTTELPAYIDPSKGRITDASTSGAILTTYGEVLKIGSNKTILGIGDKAFLNRIGLNVQAQSNIIVRNIRFSLMNVPISKDGENKIVALRNGVETLVGDPDCFSVQADKNSAKTDIAHHIWVDHCEFFNENISDKDRYDGLLDIKNNVKYVTISWCHFHHHSKACLSGKGNSDDYDRLITMHHNFFEDIDGSRLPLQRFGHTHYLNNYIKGCEDGYNLRKGSHGYVEGCYFEDTKKPLFAKEGGRATLVDLIFKNCKNLPEGYENIDGAKFSVLKADDSFETTDFVPSNYYDYSHIVHTAEETPAIVMQYVGIGKIDTTIEEPGPGTDPGTDPGPGEPEPEPDTVLFHETFSNFTTVLTSNALKNGNTDEPGYEIGGGSSDMACVEDGTLLLYGGRFQTRNLNLQGNNIKLYVTYKTNMPGADTKRFQIALDRSGSSDVSNIYNEYASESPTEFVTKEFAITEGTASSFIHFRTESSYGVILKEIKIINEEEPGNPTDLGDIEEENISVIKLEGKLAVNCQPGDLISVYQIDGKLAYSGKSTSETEFIESSSYKGVYIVRVQNRMKNYQVKVLF